MTCQALVQGFHRLDCGCVIAGVSDHVGIGEIHDDELYFFERMAWRPLGHLNALISGFRS